MSAITRKKKSTGEAWSEWVDGMHQALAEAKAVLKGHEPLTHESLETLMRDFHLIKGYAQPLGLHGVQRVAHELETRIVGLIREARREVTGAGLKAILVEGLLKLDGIFSKLHEVQIRSAAERELGGSRGEAQMPRFDSLWGRMEASARSLAVELSREIRFQARGGDLPMERSWEAPLEAALLHAVRNSLDHGSGSGARLELSLSVARKGSEIVVEFSDSGAGIDPQRVREAARERGLPFDAELTRMSDDEALQLLFLSGFSLSRGVSLLSGRGYGLDIVREAIEGRLGGKARIESRSGRGTKLILQWPDRPRNS